MKSSRTLSLGDKHRLSMRAAQRIQHTDLEMVPSMILRIIEVEAWGERQLEDGTIYRLNSLRELIEKPPLEGWGMKVDTVRKLLKDHPEAEQAFREATKEKPGPKSGDNITLTRSEKGTSRAYTLTRLKKHDEKQGTEYFSRVCKGELSANAAAIEAGIRKRQSPLQALKAAWRKASVEEREEFHDWISKQD